MTSVRATTTAPSDGPGNFGRPRRGSRGAGERFDWQMLALITFLVVPVLYLWAAYARHEVTLGGLLAMPVLAAIGLPIIALVTRRDRGFDLSGLVALSLGLRFAVAVPRLMTAVDATVYHQEGIRIAESFRSLQFAVDTGRQVPGTGSVRYLSGLVHVVTSNDEFATFLVFAFFAFWGTWFCYRAFEIAVPEGNHYRYAKLIFLWPSLLYWSSSLGKEACMTFGIGLASLGIAWVVARRWSGLAVTALGILATTMIRPHLGLIIMVALCIAVVFPRSVAGSTFTTGIRVAAIVVLIVGGSILARTTAEYLKLENLGNEQIDQALSNTEEQTSQGGSNFSSARVRTPLDYPVAVVTVIARPFPFEAHTGEAAMSSLEGLLLLVLLVRAVPDLVHLPRLLMRYSYVTYALAYVLVFCFVFAVIANFGILVRQRVQMLPMLFVLVALPTLEVAGRGRGSLASRLPDPRRPRHARHHG